MNEVKLTAYSVLRSIANDGYLSDTNTARAQEVLNKPVNSESQIEEVAKAIYAMFPGARAYPWVELGISGAQSDARRYAKAAIAAINGK